MPHLKPLCASSHIVAPLRFPLCAPLHHTKSKPPPQRRRLVTGGAKGIRTPDLNTASVALFQLSYGPESGGGEGIRTPDLDSAIVALYQLSYTPAHAVLSYHEPQVMSNKHGGGCLSPKQLASCSGQGEYYAPRAAPPHHARPQLLSIIPAHIPCGDG